MARPNCQHSVRFLGNSWRGRWLGMPLNMGSSDIRFLIYNLQVFSPANVIFAGVGVLLSVRIFLFTFARAFVTRLSGSYGCSRKPRHSD